MLKRVLLVLLSAPAAALAEQRTRNLYWTPENVTVGGRDIDMMLNIILVLTVVVFVLTQGVFIWYLVKYRRKPGVKAKYSHGHNLLEVIWTAAPTAIFLFLAFLGNRIWFNLHRDPPADAIPIDIVGYQFGWDIRYPGQDGKLGAAKVENMTVDNKFGLIATDSNGADDFGTTEMVIPVGHPIHLYLRAKDVIHSFYVPEFRLYQDAVPGRTISWVWFETTREGNFELACSQLCGAGHYNMKAKIRVVSQEEYDRWFDEKAKQAEERKQEAAALTARRIE